MNPYNLSYPHARAPDDVLLSLNGYTASPASKALRRAHEVRHWVARDLIGRQRDLRFRLLVRRRRARLPLPFRLGSAQARLMDEFGRLPIVGRVETHKALAPEAVTVCARIGESVFG